MTMMPQTTEVAVQQSLPLNVPIMLTWLRVALIPLLVGVYYLPDGWLTVWQQGVAATAIFIVAAITDWVDGWLARRWNQISDFGAFLDPVADKLMVAGALVVLMQLDRVNAVLGFVIIGREIAISALREWMATIGASQSVAVNSLGKIKTISQMIAIPMLLYYDTLFGVLDTRIIGMWLLVLAAILTVWSMFYYLRRALPSIREKTTF